MKAKIGKLFSYIENKVLNKGLMGWQQVLIYVAMKYLYMLLTVLILKDRSYQGSNSYMVDFIWWKECIASIMFMGVSWGFVKWFKEDSLARTLLHMLFVLYYIPVNSSFAINNTQWQYFALGNVYFVLLLTAVGGLLRLVNTICHSNKVFGEKTNMDSPIFKVLINGFCVIICLLLIAHKISYNGLSFSLSMGAELYDNRAAYVDYMDAYSGTLYSYAVVTIMNLGGYVAPFYLLYSLILKKWAGVGISVISLLSIFSVSSGKSTLFFMAIVAALYILHQIKWLKYFNRIFDSGILFLMMACLLGCLFGTKNSLFMLIVRREMYFPAWLNWLYYDFYSHADKLYWSQSAMILQNLIDLGNEVSPLKQISDAYFQGLVPSPNTGMFAEAYMQCGAFGIIIYPVLLAATFVAAEKIMDTYELVFAAFMACKFVLALTNVPLLRTDTVLSFFSFMFVLWFIGVVLRKYGHVRISEKIKRR